MLRVELISNVFLSFCSVSNLLEIFNKKPYVCKSYFNFYYFESTKWIDLRINSHMKYYFKETLLSDKNII